MSNVSVPLGPRGQKISTVAKYVLILAGGFVAAQFIWTAIGGLIGIGVAAAVYAFMVAMAPVVSLKLSNFATNRFIAEVWANPVESRLTARLEAVKGISAQEKFCREITGAFHEFQDSVRQLIADYPEEKERFAQQLTNMEDQVEESYGVLKINISALESFDKMTNKVSAIWKAAQAQLKAEKMFGKDPKKEALLKIINDESIKASDAALAQGAAAIDHMRRMRTGKDVSIERTTTLKLERQSDGSFILPTMKVAQPQPIEV